MKVVPVHLVCRLVAHHLDEDGDGCMIMTGGITPNKFVRLCHTI